MSADAGVCCLTGVSGRSKESRSLAKNRGNLALRIATAIAGGSALVLLSAFSAFAQEEGPAPAGEANLKLPDLSSILIGQGDGVDESLISMIKQVSEFLSKVKAEYFKKL